MNDIISRQAAIDEIDEWIKAFRENGHKESAADACLIQDGIIQLPSAHPEIIYCKECKHWMPHSQLGYDEDNETYHDYCEKLIPEDEYYAFYRDADDFCSRAERKENR